MAFLDWMGLWVRKVSKVSRALLVHLGFQDSRVHRVHLAFKVQRGTAASFSREKKGGKEMWGFLDRPAHRRPRGY